MGKENEIAEFVRGFPVHLVEKGEAFNPHVVAHNDEAAVMVELPGEISWVAAAGAGTLALWLLRVKGGGLGDEHLCCFADSWLRTIEDNFARRRSQLNWIEFVQGERLTVKSRIYRSDSAAVEWEHEGWREMLETALPVSDWNQTLLAMSQTMLRQVPAADLERMAAMAMVSFKLAPAMVRFDNDKKGWWH